MKIFISEEPVSIRKAAVPMAKGDVIIDSMIKTEVVAPAFKTEVAANTVVGYDFYGSSQTACENKIAVIKIFRSVTKLGLKDSKDFVDGIWHLFEKGDLTFVFLTVFRPDGIYNQGSQIKCLGLAE